MSPLRKLAMEERPKRNPIHVPEKQVKAKRLVTGPRAAWVKPRIPVPKTGPRLVQDANKVHKIVQGDYVAEVTVNRNSTPELFHYLVVKKDSPAILEWGQTISVHAAVHKAKLTLKRLIAEDNRPDKLVAAD